MLYKTCYSNIELISLLDTNRSDYIFLQVAIQNILGFSLLISIGEVRDETRQNMRHIFCPESFFGTPSCPINTLR